jgi:hypothetical protein
MSDLIFHLVTWPAVGIALLVWGFAPGALLRLIVLAFPRDDPRRRELRGELYAVPRFWRPFWVVEQLEVALVEGLGQRLVWAATGRIIYRWHLADGVRRNRKHPDTFDVPSQQERHAVVPGMDVQLSFELNPHAFDRMWVTVTAVKGRKLVGTLCNSPIIVPRLVPGDKIKFNRKHIIGISAEPSAHCPVHDRVFPVHCECHSAHEDDYLGSGEPPAEDWAPGYLGPAWRRCRPIDAQRPPRCPGAET